MLLLLRPQLATEPELQGLRFLVTSHVPLEVLGVAAALQERRIAALSAPAACELVVSIAKDITDTDAQRQVAEACQCVPLVPLYLRLVAEALVAGRLALEVSSPVLSMAAS